MPDTQKTRLYDERVNRA